MDSRDIRFFMTVCECGSITQAAGHLFVTPQALSKTIKKIENEVGVNLFLRNVSGVVLTENGKKFYEKGAELIEKFDELDNLFRLSEENTHAELKVAFTLGVVQGLNPDKLLRFSELHPNISVKIIEQNDHQVEKLVESGTVDLGITSLPVDTKEFDVIPLHSVRECAVINRENPLSKKEKLTFADLKGQKFAISNKNFKAYDKFVNCCRFADFEPDIYYETTEMSVAHYLAEINKCIAISVDTQIEVIPQVNTVKCQLPSSFVWEWGIIKRKDMQMTSLVCNYIEFINGLAEEMEQ